MKIKINAKTLGAHSKGDIVDVSDVDGIPTEQFWRRRLKDSAIDDCCEVVDEITKAKPRVAVVTSEPTKDDN